MKKLNKKIEEVVVGSGFSIALLGHEVIMVTSAILIGLILWQVKLFVAPLAAVMIYFLLKNNRN